MKIFIGIIILAAIFTVNSKPQNYTGQLGRQENLKKSTSISFLDLAGGVNNSVYAIEVSGDDVYVGGRFTTAGGINVNHIARWDGTNWHSLGTGVSGTGLGISVRAIAVVGDNVYVGGYFTNAGGTSVSNIAMWNDTTWQPLGSGANNGVHGGVVNSIVASDTVIYVGGFFTSEGNKSIIGIARWDGNDWSPIGNQISQTVKVTSLYVSGTDLYVGGTFTNIGNTQANNIAKWDGVTWSPFGGGIPGNGPVYSISVSGGFVYAGTVIPADTALINDIVRWDGTSWNSIGGKIGTVAGDRVNTIVVIGDYIYAGGEFHNSNGSTFHLSKFDGGTWNNIDVDSVVYTLKINQNNNKMLIGGDFIYAGGTNVNYIAEFTDSPLQVKTTAKLPTDYQLNQNFPNPFNPTTKIRFELPEPSNVEIEVFNSLGERVASLVNEVLSAGYHEITLNAESLSSGVYFYRLQTENYLETKKMILLR